eukprot:TRINITY_DN11696_c0_g1_i1.p2 TRINITY_DN11696_c0_g1~~TRINITY_DN11696_c0_g1_i1.p2  ORF type:complete len:156 (+),score=36.23 TRINITY_DN11696_c0_g1_i1:55-522(+)
MTTKKVDSEAFTALCDDKQQKGRTRHTGFQSQKEKNKQNREALADTIGEWQAREAEKKAKPANTTTHEIDLDIAVGQDGCLDPTAGKNTKKKHFTSIDENVEDIEKKMAADAPKAQTKLDDVFDQSYKDLMRDTKSVVTGTIAQGKADDDEFDVF